MSQRCRSRIIGFTAIVVLSMASGVSGYELGTHRLITEHGFDRSVLPGGYLEQELGISLTGKLQGPDGQGLQPVEWVEEGSVREDSFAFFSRQPLRFRHHFYDPHFDRGLTVGTTLGHRAFDWALEEAQEISGQDFSWRDARRYFFEALTLAASDQREAQMARTFRTLGHVIHLIQDMGSPEHTRNDAHLFGSLFERRIDDEREQFDYSGYPVPGFTQRRDFWRTGDGRGFSEFTNRSFISEDTNFNRTEEGSTGGPYPLPRLTLDLREEVDIRALIPTSPLQGTVTFFGNDVDDRVTGSVIRNSRMTSYSLFDSALRRQGHNEVFTVNRFTIRRAGEILLPRAVGYSAGLLDHFFRGKLELEFTPDPTDSTRLLLAVINRSGEAGGPGATPATLTVHVDNPATGIREERARLDVTSPVDPDGAFTSLPVDATLEFSPITVVYRGKLGQEEGAVIGKVQAAPEVEQIFRGTTDWMLRTADGIFPLGLGTAPGQVKWGDRDNMLVARTFLAGGDQRFQGYRINRPEGSPDVPLTPHPVDPLQTVVDLIPIGSPVTLSGQAPIDLGTRLSVNRVVDYTQQLGTVRVKYLYVFDPEIDNWKVVDKEFLGGGLETVHEQTLSHSTPSVALIMSPTTMSLPQSTTSPFFWIPGNFYLNPDGDVLVDVSVRLTRPSASVPLVRHDASGNLVGDGSFGSGFVSFATPQPPFEFVVNLTRRTVVAKTCADTIDVTFRDRQGDFLVDLQATHVRDEETTTFGPAATLGPASGEEVVFEVAVRTGTIQAWSSPGVYRSDFTHRGFWNGTDITLQAVVTGDEVVAFRDPLAVGGNPLLGSAMRQTVFQTDEASRIMVLAELNRADGPGEGYLALGWQANLSFEKWTPHRWHPRAGTVTAPLPGLTLPTDVNTTAFTRGANRGTAMFRTSISQGPSFTHLVTERDELVFTGATGSTVASQYQLLQPNVLFNTADLRFHRLSPELELLPAPRPLAPGGPASGEYHVVGRP